MCLLESGTGSYNSPGHITPPTKEVRIQELADGSKVKTSEIKREINNIEHSEKILKQITSDFKSDLECIENQKVKASFDTIINENKFLSNRRKNVYKQLNLYNIWISAHTDVNWEYVVQNFPYRKYPGFLCRFEWNDCLLYCEALFQLECSKNGTNMESWVSYKNGFFSQCLIDKLVYLSNSCDPSIFPKCISMGEHVNVSYGLNDTISGFNKSLFVFDHANIVQELCGYSFSPSQFYFPTDIMLHGVYKHLFIEQLECDREVIMDNIHGNPYFINTCLSYNK